MRNAMLATIWLTFHRFSGDWDQFGINYSNFKHDKSRRNALILLVSAVTAEKVDPGRCAIYRRSVVAGPAAAANRLGGMPSQPEARRNLLVSDRRVRSGLLVDG